MGMCVYCCALAAQSWTLCRGLLVNDPVVFPDLLGSSVHSADTAVSLKKLTLEDVASTGQTGGVEGGGINNLLLFHHLQSPHPCSPQMLEGLPADIPETGESCYFMSFLTLKNVRLIHLCRPADAPREKPNRIWAALNNEWLLSLVNLLLTRFRGQQPICQMSRLRLQQQIRT